MTLFMARSSVAAQRRKTFDVPWTKSFCDSSRDTRAPTRDKTGRDGLPGHAMFTAVSDFSTELAAIVWASLHRVPLPQRAIGRYSCLNRRPRDRLLPFDGQEVGLHWAVLRQHLQPDWARPA
ncbi:hypothetical protein ACVDG8_008145 [Mesorhizobium sp. ORM8.1]